MNELTVVMSERKQNHGPFSDVAAVMIQTIGIWERAPNWNKLNPVQEASLREIAHKVARILSGDPNFEEHWLDGAGYFMLGREGSK